MITEQQRIDRRLGIGGSDVRIIFGESKKFYTPLDLYLEKLGMFAGDFVEEENVPAELGNILEPYVAAKYEKRSGTILAQKDAIETKIDAQYPFMRANIDGITHDGGIFEAKTTSIMCRKNWGEPGTSQIPDSHLMQVAYYTSIYDAPYADICVLFMGSPHYEIYRYERDLVVETTIRTAVKNFWENHVLKKIPPEASTFGDLLNLYPRLDPESCVNLDDSVEEDWDQFIHINEQIKVLEEEKEKRKFAVAKFIGEKEYLLGHDNEELASFKYSKTSTRMDLAALKKDHLDIWTKYQKAANPVRTLRIKGNGK